MPVTYGVGQRHSRNSLFVLDHYGGAPACLPCLRLCLQRDIKTGNIFLCKEGHVQLGDFGLASVKDGNDVNAEHDQSLVCGMCMHACAGVCVCMHARVVVHVLVLQ